MSTKFLSPGWRMPRNANQSKQSNYSMDFGSNQGVNVSGTSLQFSGSTSFSAWFKMDGSVSTSVRDIFSKGIEPTSSFIIRVQKLNNIYKVRFQIQVSGGAYISIWSSTSPTVTPDVWHHVVGVFDVANNQLKLYYDGTEVSGSGASLNGATELQNTNDDLKIGIFQQNQYDFIGQITEVSIFDYALSPSQVTTLWGGGTSVSNPMALPSPPIAYYPLGESAGGFVGGSGTWLTENNAIGDYVFDFDSSLINPSVTLTELGISNEFSVSLWANVDTITSYRGPLGATSNSNWPDGFGIYINANKWNFFVDHWSNSKVTSDTTITVNTWVHLVGTFSSSGTGKLYINGVKEGTDFTGVTLDGLSNNFAIGNVYNGGGFFQGKMSNVQIWNKELIATEVETLYNYGSPIQTLANIPQNSNLKAWYKLDASEVYNSSTTEWEINEATSPWTSSLSFEFSNNSKISTGNITSLNSVSNASYSFWFKATSSTGYPTAGALIGTANTSATTAYFYNNTLYIHTLYGGFITTSIPALNQWHHVCCTFNAGSSKAFINGVLVGTKTGEQSTTNANAGTDFSIGYSPNYNFYFINGQISNVSLFNTTLTDGSASSIGDAATGQIAELYNNGSPLSDMSSFTSLVSWYKLNNTNTGIEDSSGNGNNGTNNGATEVYGSVSTLNGESSGMSQSNLVQSDLQTVAPYSKYAMDFDGTNHLGGSGYSIFNLQTISYSIWFKRTGNLTATCVLMTRGQSSNIGWTLWLSNSILIAQFADSENDSYNNSRIADYKTAIPDNTWGNVIATFDGTNQKIYVNGQLLNTYSKNAAIDYGQSSIFYIGQRANGSANFTGEISNPSIWNTALTSAQVLEIYNQGLPSNLNSHSAYSNLVSWWQLGENSSFATNWICADEKSSNNLTSTGMGVDALINGVGTTANGVSSGMSEGDLVGDAPYSTANALSSGMAVQAFDSANPPNVISGRSEDVP